MYHMVVFASQNSEWVNMNDEHGLDAIADYTREQYLEDLASEGLTVTASVGNVFMFSDGSLQVIRESSEPIVLAELDEESRNLVLANAAFGAMQALPAFQCLPAACC